MRTIPLVLLVAAACSSHEADVCAAAAELIHECTGQRPTTWGSCTGETRDTAAQIAALDCEGLSHADAVGKADGSCTRFFFFSFGDCDQPVSQGLANLPLLEKVRANFPPPGSYKAQFTDEAYGSHGVVFTCGVTITETPGLTAGTPTAKDRYTVEVRSDFAVDDVALGVFQIGLSDDFIVKRYESTDAGGLTVVTSFSGDTTALQLTPYPVAPSFEVLAQDSTLSLAGGGGRCFTGMKPM